MKRKLVKRNFKKKKKGFTLIELLAVILILGIIALIAIPTVNDIIKVARKNAFRATSYSLIEAARQQFFQNQIQGTTAARTYTFPNSGLSVKGKQPTGGKLIINTEGDTLLQVNDNEWCAVKDYSEEKVRVYELGNTFCDDATVLDPNYKEDGSSGSDGTGGGNDSSKLLTTNILAKSAADMKKGTTITNDYDVSLATEENKTLHGYYDNYHMVGSNPKNYIKFNNKLFRVLEINKYGTVIIGDATDYVISSKGEYGDVYRYSLKAGQSIKTLAQLGVETDAYYYGSNKYAGSTTMDGASGSASGPGYDGFFNYSPWADTTHSAYAPLSMFDYEITINRQNYKDCLTTQLGAGATADYTLHNTCAQSSWIGSFGNNLYMSNGFWFGSTNATSGTRLYNGKLNVLYRAVCEDCSYLIKFTLSNASEYVSGDGTQANPYIYKTPTDSIKYATASKCFDFDDEDGSIYRYNSYDSDCGTDIFLPSIINNVKVKKISSQAFKDSSFKINYIEFSENIESIGASAFQDAQIKSIDFSRATALKTIGDNAFYGNSFTTLDLSKSTLLETIGTSSFYNVPLTSLTLPNNASSFTTIGMSAFYYNSLSSITIPSSVNTLDTYSFYTNSKTLKSVIIKGKSNTTDFTKYDPVWAWASGYSDASNISWPDKK